MSDFFKEMVNEAKKIEEEYEKYGPVEYLFYIKNCADKEEEKISNLIKTAVNNGHKSIIYFSEIMTGSDDNREEVTDTVMNFNLYNPKN